MAGRREQGTLTQVRQESGIRASGMAIASPVKPSHPFRFAHVPSPSREGLKYGQVSVAYKMTRIWDRENIETSAPISRAENSSRSGIMF